MAKKKWATQRERMEKARIWYEKYIKESEILGFEDGEGPSLKKFKKPILINTFNRLKKEDKDEEDKKDD